MDVAKKHRKAPIRIMWTEGGAQPATESALGLTFGFPAVAALSKEKGVYATMKVGGMNGDRGVVILCLREEGQQDYTRACVLNPLVLNIGHRLPLPPQQGSFDAQKIGNFITGALWLCFGTEGGLSIRVLCAVI